ncbi:MAG: hypothetical protein GY754_01110 [bacterium]|nr:hypothetical protein [bacterium]
MKQFNFVVILIIIIFLSLIISCQKSYPRGITQVTIKSKSFDWVKELSREEIVYLEKAFPTFQKINLPPDYQWSYSINIKSKKSGGSWLYNKKGYIARLNYSLKPSYKIPNPEEFNKKLFEDNK